MLAMRAQMSGNVPPVVQSSFINALNDYTTLSTVSTMPDGGSITRAGNAMLYDSTGALTYAPNNLLTYSEQFDNAAWTKTSTTISANVTTAPDSTNTADKLVEGTGSITPYISAAPTVTANINNLFSVYIKAAGRTSVRLFANSTATCYSWFDLSNGTVGTKTGTTATITSVGNGWYRCSITFTPTATPGYVQILMGNPNETPTYTGDGTSGVYLWGAQLEAVTYQTTPSTYVATTSAAYYGPRFDYDPSVTPATAKGLLVEGARTNLQPYSQAFNNWTASTPQKASFNVAATTQPDGTSSGYALVEDNTAGIHQGYYGSYSRGSTSAITYTATVYAKSTNRRLQIIILNGPQTSSASVTFDLVGSQIGVAAAVAGSYTAPSASIVNVGNSWCRCSLTFTSDTNGSFYYVFAMDNGTGTGAQSNNYTGNGTANINLFGAQVEAGSFATSYIPTVASSVARAAETFTLANYQNRLVESFYIDEETGGSWSANINASATSPLTISTPTFGWLTSLRAYTNAYAGDITTPSWIDNSGTTGNRMYYDSTGALTWAPANMLTYSQDFSNGIWQRASISASLPTKGTTTTDRPNGTTGTVDTIAFPAVSSSQASFVFQDLGTPVVNIPFVFSIYARVASGTASVYLNIEDAAAAPSSGNYVSGSAQTLTTSWQRIYLAGTRTSNTGGIVASIGFDTRAAAGQTNGSSLTIQVWGAQFEQVTYQTSPRAYIQTPSAAVYQPRYDYDPSVTPATPRGMLIEEQRVNICLYSQNFGNAAWSKASFTGTVSQDTSETTSPDGTTNSAKLTAAAANDFIVQAVTLTAAAYTYSVYLKAGSATSVRVNIYDTSDHYTVFNVSAGTVGTTVGVTSSAITSVGNGWYRCSITFTAAAVSSQVRVLAPAAGTFYAYGAQVELGSFPTSYIPTTTGSVTRAADVVKLSGSALTTAGGNICSAIIQTTLLEGMFGSTGLIGTSSSRRLMFVNPTAFGTNIVASSDGVTGLTATFGGAGTYLTVPSRSAVAWNASGRSLVVNNGTVASDAVNLGAGATVFLGAFASGSNISNGWYGSMALYNQRLPNAILKQKSTVNAPY